jgi:hypothetical protein
MAVILFTLAELGDGKKKISFREFITSLSKSLKEARHEGELGLFREFAERLEYLKTPPVPTAEGFAIDALQDAFIGLTWRKYRWGKKGFPTKGEVTEMAKASLSESGRDVRKGGWTHLLRKAHLDWLPEGKAGRPSKAGLDETEKATREFKSICTRMVKEKFGGSFILARDAARAAYGNKSEYKRSELDRLSSSPANEAEDAELG